MTVLSPVRFHRLQVALVELVAGFLPAGATVALADQQRPRDAAGSVLATLKISPPRREAFADGQATIAVPSLATVTVLAALADARYSVEVNGLDLFHDAGGAPTLGSVRDGIKAAIDADQLAFPDAHLTTGTSGGAALTLAPAQPGWLFDLVVRPTALLSVVLGAPTYHTLVSGSRLVDVELQLWVRRAAGATQSPRSGAQDLLARVLSGLDHPTTTTRLVRDGFAQAGSSFPVDLTALAGAEFSSRAAVDLTFRLPSFALEPIDVVEHVTPVAVLHDGLTPTTLTFPTVTDPP